MKDQSKTPPKKDKLTREEVLKIRQEKFDKIKKQEVVKK